ncbi:MAG: hypothetical protein KDI83_00165 [Gammaproteobacteria bacterium]|nr:hypothetical protein [Gammaproteobacteria bacterium]
MQKITDLLKKYSLPLSFTALIWLLFFTVGVRWIGELPPAPAEAGGALFYQLVKGAMLWIPLGLLFTLAGRDETFKRWFLSGVFTFLIVSLTPVVKLGLWDYLEVVGAVIGTGIGVWIGTRILAKSLYPSGEADAALAFADQPLDSPLDVSSSGERPASEQLPAYPVQAASALALLRLPLVLLILGLAGWAIWNFPRWQIELGVVLLVYFMLLLRLRYAWLFILPALLPTFSLVPWTGRFSLDEFDLVMLVTLAAVIYHGPHPEHRPLMPRPIGLLFSAYALICVSAFFIGVFPLPVNLELNFFNNYFSGFHSWDVGKGFLWGFMFLGLARWTLPGGTRLMERLFVPGLLCGLFFVALVGLRERWQYADLLDFSVPYRITATFWSMHTGGAHLDAYLALLVPFIGFWMVRNGRFWIWTVGLVLFLLSVYLVISTGTRTTLVVLCMEMLLMGLFVIKRFYNARNRGLSNLLVGTLITVIVGPLLYLGTSGSFFQQRLDQVERDAEVRLGHWTKITNMMDTDIVSQMLGMGFGRFPAIYLERHQSGATPGRYEFRQLGDNTYLTLYPGDTLYLAQKVRVFDHQEYQLSLDMKSRQKDLMISVPLCEKHLLNSKRCHWHSHRFPGGSDGWHHWVLQFNTGPLGEGSWLGRPPTELYLYNPNEIGTVDLDNISLIDAGGNELLHNGGFDLGGDFWFFKTHEHLPWHIKNLWLAAFFDQGWSGVILLSLLLAVVSLYFFGPAWYAGNSAAAVVVVALVGFIATGLFASPFDAPRITQLFFMVIGFGLFETVNGTGYRQTR